MTPDWADEKARALLAGCAPDNGCLEPGICACWWARTFRAIVVELREVEERGAERGRREERRGCYDIKLTSERGVVVPLPEWVRDAIAARGPMAEEER